MIMWQK